MSEQKLTGVLLTEQPLVADPPADAKDLISPTSEKDNTEAFQVDSDTDSTVYDKVDGANGVSWSYKGPALFCILFLTRK